MATGDQADMVGRLQRLLPQGWFPSDLTTAPVLNAVLNGFAGALAQSYSLITFALSAVLNTTAQNIWLDIKAQDYLGSSVQRRTQESDHSFRGRMTAAIFPPGATRAALIGRLTALTGSAPMVFEPTQPMDTGAYTSETTSQIAITAANLIAPWSLGTPTIDPNGREAAQIIDGGFGGSLALDLSESGAVFGVVLQVFIPSGTPEVGNVLIYFGASQIANVTVFDEWVTVSVPTPTASGGVLYIYGGTSASVGAFFYLSAVAFYASNKGGSAGYNTSGAYGSLALPFQAFVTVQRPVSQGAPLLAGYSGNKLSPVYAPLGYGAGLGSYVDLAQAFDGVTDNDIYQTVAEIEPAGSIIWTRITS